MHEKLIDDWLTNVNELGYQLPFCEVLVAEGYTLIHVSTHGRGEHGKDIVARQPDGALVSFQLKGGDIGLQEWRKIRGEVEELVQLPVRLPGVLESESHIPHLVTNGEIRGDALESITRYSDTWQSMGFQKMQVWSRRIVLRKFIDAQGAFLPGDLQEFRRFVELYVGNFKGPFPRSKFARLMEASTEQLRELSVLKMRRGLAALALIAGYIVEQYERFGNYMAAAEGWTMAAANIMHVAEREGLERKTYESSLALLHSALVRALDNLASEALESESFSVSPYGLADPHIYGVRVCLTLGWVSVWALDRKWRRGECVETERMLRLLKREYPAHKRAGEVDWPFIMVLALYLDREWLQSDAEEVVIRYANSIMAINRGERPGGVPSPYWSHEKVLRLANGMLSPFALENFGGHSYTLRQALDMLVRRLRRQAVRVMWPSASKLLFCDFVPDRLADYFLWRCKQGNLSVADLDRTASWSAWRAESGSLDAQLVPKLLVRHPEWVLPFLLTYPHRANRNLCAFAEAANDRYVQLL